MWFYLMQIILILRSIRTFAIKNLSGPSYQGYCLRWAVGWLRSIIACIKTFFQSLLEALLKQLYQSNICSHYKVSTIQEALCPELHILLSKHQYHKSRLTDYLALG